MKILITIVVIAASVLGGARFYQWYKEGHIGKEIEAARANLDKARELVTQGSLTEAKDLLEPIVARVQNDVITPDALMLLAEIVQSIGHKQKALELLKRANNEFPNSSRRPRAAIAYARLLEDMGRSNEAVSVYERVCAEAPAALRAPALAGLGREAERNDDLIAARDLYHRAAREAEWDSEPWNEALDALGRANVALIFSPGQIPESKAYTVEEGDNLTSIGVKLNTPQGMLTRANDIEDPTKIWPGQRLKYTPKDFRIVIERSSCRLFLLDKDGLFKRYYTGLGKKGHETTLGTYKIGNKEKNPVWHKRGEGPIPPGDPRNELGTRWMPFVPVEEGLPKDLGIHGTSKPETVGTYVSMGCVRLFREDVEELYDLVVRSTPVQIVEVFNPEQAYETVLDI